MKRVFHVLRGSAFLRHNAIFLFGSVAVGALNYLYYPVLGHLLVPSVFGEVQVLVSLFLQLTIFLTVLSLVTVNVTANYHDETLRNEVIFELEKVALVISLVLLGLTIVAGEPLRHFLHFSSSWPFVLLSIALVVTVPFTFRLAYLRGMQQFGTTSLANMYGAGGKLVLSVLFVLIGWGTSGAIGGLVMAQLVAFWYAARRASRSGLAQPKKYMWGLPKLHRIAPELRYSFFVLVGSLAVTVLFSVDVVVVKHFFDPHIAGLYAGIATVARVIFFVTASVVQVMLSSVKLDHSRRANRQLLLKSSVLLIGLSLPVVAIFTFFPHWVVVTLMGHSYDAYAWLLPRLGWAIFVISIINLLVSYSLALRQYLPGIVAMIGTGMVYEIMTFHHNSLSVIVEVLLYGSIGTVCLILLMIGSKLFERREGDATTHIDHRTDP